VGALVRKTLKTKELDMKVITVRYLPPTDYKGSRYKASAEDVKSITESFYYSDSDQTLDMARQMVTRAGWNVDVTGRGTLPNGDEVFTLGKTI
jgi:hypothetical protein